MLLGDHRTILDVPVLQYGTKKILSQLTSFAICPESKSSKLKLRKLPDFLSKMTSLTKLTIDLPLLGKQDGDQWDFEGDEIPAFPLSLTALTNLETLNVENCPHEALGSLLPWVFQLPKLKHLTIAFTDVWNLACPPKLQEFRDKQLEDLWFCTTKVERTPPPSSGGCVIS